MATSTRTHKQSASLLNIEEIRREKAIRCKASFAYFVHQAWPVIEPGTPLIWNWHLDAMCDHLQAAYEGRIQRLLINIAPGHAKSTIVSVLFPVWVWLHDPYSRWLCASHSLDLANRDNKNRRDLISSDWFQERFGNDFRLSSSQNVKGYFENEHRGYMMAMAVRSSGTGKRADWLLIDDPNNAMAGEADILAVKDWFGKTWTSRLNDQEHGPMIIVGQRLHENDLSSHILELGGWVHLSLPTEFEPSRKCSTSIGWEDPRTEEGELLWAAKFPTEVIESLKRSMGLMAYEAQHQQNPMSPSGKPFMPEYQRYFTIDHLTESYLLETPRGIKPVPIADCWKFCVIDPAISLKQSADFFVMAAYAVTPYRDTLLLEIFRGHYSHPEQKDHLVLFHQKYGFQLVAVESVGYQAALVQSALLEGVPCTEFHVHSDKLTRSGTASIWDKNGKSYTLKDAPWIFEYQTEIFAFPGGKKDDQADTKSMSAIVVCTRRTPGVLDLANDDSVKKIDPTLSIEQIIDATAIAAEQAVLAAEEAKEQGPREIERLQANPWEWAMAHEGGGWE